MFLLECDYKTFLNVQSFIFDRKRKLFSASLAWLLLLLSGGTESWWWSSDSTSNARSVTNVTVMDGG